MARMRTSNGTANLIPAEVGNVRAVKHGIWSERVLAPRIEAYRERLLALPHIAEVDEAAVDECSRLLARIEAVDADIDERGHFGKRGARSLLEHRARLSRELRAWLGALGALPSARADWTAKLTRGSLNNEIRARLAAVTEREARQ